MTRWLTVAALVVTLLVGSMSETGSAGSPAEAARAPQRPDIVLILMDDFSLELLSTMRQARRMSREGSTYENAFVVDSLCCPSRTSLLTGRMPHQTGVLTNTARNRTNPIGGYGAFRHNHNGLRTFNLRLHNNGYRTGFIGKFLNGYEPRSVDGHIAPPAKVPGWDDWQVVFGGGYNGWGLWSSYVENGELRLRRHNAPPRSASVATRDRQYSTNVMFRKAVRFIRRHRDDAAPYFLEIATYGPHQSLNRAYRNDPIYPPAFRDRPTAAWPGGNCGLRACSPPTCATWSGTTTRAATTRRPTSGRTGVPWRRRPGATTRSGSPTARPARTCATGPGWCSRSTG